MSRRLLKNRESNHQALTTVFIRMLLTMFFASTYSATIELIFMVGSLGIEPSQAEPTDLQSAPRP